jgi:hypothetical protein
MVHKVVILDIPVIPVDIQVDPVESNNVVTLMVPWVFLLVVEEVLVVLVVLVVLRVVLVKVAHLHKDLVTVTVTVNKPV